MATIYQPVTVKPIPRNAVVGATNGRRVARWVARGGQSVTAELTADGKKVRVRSRTWWVEYTDAAGVRQRAKGFRDRAATLQLAARLERRAEGVRAGKEEPDPPGGPAHLADHVGAFREHLAQLGRDPKYVNQAVLYVTAFLSGVPVTTAAAVDCERVSSWLRREGKRPGNDWSVRTLNCRVGHLRQFGAWLVATRRAKFNPFAGVPRVGKAEQSRVVTRRAIASAELVRLIDAAFASADTVHGLPGPERAVLYVVAAYTGRRIGALAKMTPESFLWDGGLPVACVSSARMQKSKKPHTVPLHPDVSAKLAPWLAAKPPGRPLWSGWKTWATKGAKMLRHDLAAAGIPFKDAAGDVFDFHALRGQFVTELARSGVPLTAAQALADHSSPSLTSNVYTKWSRELAGEVAKLPGLGSGLGSQLAGVVQNGGQASGEEAGRK